ncbi:acylphosphatase [Conexibacter sp. SYSU D00693]|uniref:acylphosphatase n=1 Tax=Conexibacter sp. SYSU D00693 TaxID=2812560 RepID=UPI00196A9C95|nr:acylphosphatase [Conexibacter sp. SYSU D00693]
MAEQTAVRAVAHGRVQGVGFRDFVVQHAAGLGVLGWVVNQEDRTVLVHAEGEDEGVQQLVELLHDGPPAAQVDGVTVERVDVEGHEQFAVRGVPAGRFAVHELDVPGGGFELRLEVGDREWAWALRKTPSLAPADKRLAVELERPNTDVPSSVWDEGLYEQRGRVPWPAALERGHAMVELHGERLRGGFALQRTKPGVRPQWLLVKRRDVHAEG